VVGVYVGQSSGSLLSMARQPTLAPLPIQIFGGLFFGIFRHFFTLLSVSGLDRGSHRPSPRSPGLSPFTRCFGRGSGRLSPVSAGSSPYASCLDRGSRRRSLPSTALLAVCPWPPPELPSAVLGLVRLLAVWPQLRRGLPSTVPGLGRLLTVRLRSRQGFTPSQSSRRPISREK